MDEAVLFQERESAKQLMINSSSLSLRQFLFKQLLELSSLTELHSQTEVPVWVYVNQFCLHQILVLQKRRGGQFCVLRRAQVVRFLLLLQTFHGELSSLVHTQVNVSVRTFAQLLLELRQILLNIRYQITHPFDMGK